MYISSFNQERMNIKYSCNMINVDKIKIFFIFCLYYFIDLLLLFIIPKQDSFISVSYSH